MIFYMFGPFLKSILERVYSALLFWVFCLLIGLFVFFLLSPLICNVWSTPIKLHRSAIPYHPCLIKSKAWLWYLSSSCSPRCAIGMCMISNFFVYTTLHIKLHLLDRLRQVPSWEDGGCGEVGFGHENSEMKCLDACLPPLSILKIHYHGFKAIAPKKVSH